MQVGHGFCHARGSRSAVLRLLWIANPDKEVNALTIFAATEQFPGIGSIDSDTSNLFDGGKLEIEDKVRLV